MLQALNEKIREYPHYEKRLRKFQSLPRDLQNAMDAYLARFGDEDTFAAQNFMNRLDPDDYYRKFYDPPDLFQVMTVDLPYLYRTAFFKDSSKWSKDYISRPEFRSCQEGHLCDPEIGEKSGNFGISPFVPVMSEVGPLSLCRYDTKRPLRLLVGPFITPIGSGSTDRYFEQLNGIFGLALDGYITIGHQNDITLLHPMECIGPNPIAIPALDYSEIKPGSDHTKLVHDIEMTLLKNALARKIPEQRIPNRFTISAEGDDVHPSPIVFYSDEELRRLSMTSPYDLENDLLVLSLTKDLLMSQNVTLDDKLGVGYRLHTLSDSRYLYFTSIPEFYTATERQSERVTQILGKNPAIFRYGYLGVITTEANNIIDEIERVFRS